MRPQNSNEGRQSVQHFEAVRELDQGKLNAMIVTKL